MTASVAPDRLVPDLEADILAIVGGPDRSVNRTLLRSRMGTAGGGLAFVLALIGLGTLLNDDWVRSMTPDTARSEVTGGPEGGEGERFEPPVNAGDIPPVTDDHVVQTIPELARVAPRTEAIVPRQVVAADPRVESGLIAAARDTPATGVPGARKQADVSRNQRSRYVAVSPERSAVHAMASEPNGALASAAAYNLPEKTSEQLERDRRSLLETRDSLRDLRLR